jgi:hypothetical protein
MNAHMIAPRFWIEADHGASPFQASFVGSGKWFRQVVLVTPAAGRRWQAVCRAPIGREAQRVADCGSRQTLETITRRTRGFGPAPLHQGRLTRDSPEYGRLIGSLFYFSEIFSEPVTLLTLFIAT